MPFKSRSQVRRFGSMVKREEITKKKFREWLSETLSVEALPERVKRKKIKAVRRRRLRGR